MNCPICHSSDTSIFLKREMIPTAQNLICATEDEAKTVNRGNLCLAVCQACSFVFNKDFDAMLIPYGERYDNNQMCSPLFQEYINDLIRYLVEEKNIRNKKIIEVGCGNGEFLKLLCHAGNNTGVGFDPSYSGEDIWDGGTIQFRKNFLDKTIENIKGDVIICRHVIEHVPNPIQFIKMIKETVMQNHNIQMFFETPCLKWILQHKVFWDFFYEHCSYFSETSLKVLFQKSGFEGITLRKIFHGQYMWAEIKHPQKAPLNHLSLDQEISNLIKDYTREEGKVFKDWEDLIDRRYSHGEIAVWGAGAKGATFVNLLDPKKEKINCLVDINPNKQGRFVAGTGHPIVNVTELLKRQVSSVIFMNPNYEAENQRMLHDRKIEVAVLERVGI